jgi:hypothetical protein
MSRLAKIRMTPKPARQVRRIRGQMTLLDSATVFLVLVPKRDQTFTRPESGLASDGRACRTHQSGMHRSGSSVVKFAFLPLARRLYNPGFLGNLV